MRPDHPILRAGGPVVHCLKMPILSSALPTHLFPIYLELACMAIPTRELQKIETYVGHLQPTAVDATSNEMKPVCGATDCNLYTSTTADKLIYG